VLTIFLGSTTQTENKVGAAEEGGAVADMGDQECTLVVRLGEISKCIIVSVHSTSCDRLRLLVEAAFEKPVADSLRHLRLVFDGREVPDGNQTLAEAGFGVGKMFVVAEFVAKIDSGGGGPERKFKSIPVENLPRLIQAIKEDFQKWKRESNPVYEERFPGDLLKGKEVVWDGYSDPVKYFFEKTQTDPSIKYVDLYSSELRTIATSYVWKATSLNQMAGW
jgi:hypothetical protein